MKSEKILGVVVVYKPDILELIDNINQYIKSIDKLIIWENSKILEDDKKNICTKIYDSFKVIFKGTGENVGISKAINYSINYANNNQYSYLLSMDQDSYWINFQQFKANVLKSKNKSIGIFGPKIINEYAQNDIIIKNGKLMEEVPYVITSGSLYKTEIFKKIGCFKESWFIDALDEEICYRARNFNIKTAAYNDNNVFIKQKFGNFEMKDFFYRTVGISNYSSFRYYYIIRNHIWLLKCDYVDIKEKMSIFYSYVFIPFIKVIIFEDNKINKIQRMIKGVFDGMLKNGRER